MGCGELIHGNHDNESLSNHSNQTDLNHSNQQPTSNQVDNNCSNQSGNFGINNNEPETKTCHFDDQDEMCMCNLEQMDEKQDGSKESRPEVKEFEQKSVQTDSVERRDAEVMTTPVKQTSKSPSPDRRQPLQDRRRQPSVELTNFNSHIIVLQCDLAKLRDENQAMRSHLQDSSLLDSSLLEEDLDSDNTETMETKMAALLVIFEGLQERIYCSETTERQLRDKVKLLESHVNELESSEGLARDQLEDARRSQYEVRRSLTGTHLKVKELKEIILDKDAMETGLAEKVTCLRDLMHGVKRLQVPALSAWPYRIKITDSPGLSTGMDKSYT